MIPTPEELDLAPSDAEHVNAWAAKHAHHNNDNPHCYDGTCRCTRQLAMAAAELVRTLRHRRPYDPPTAPL